MKLLRISAEKPEKGLVSFVASRISQGDILVYPTDTVYGIGCRLDPACVKKVFEIKKRSLDKPLSIAFGDLDQAKRYVNISPKEERYIKDNLGEPMTFVVKKKENVPSIVSAGLDTVGIRIIDTPLMKELLFAVGEPIITTSANVSGRKAPGRFEEISREVLEKADIGIDAGPCRTGTPSRVVCPGSGKVLRES